MLFYFFLFIVFISELIVTYTIISYLIGIDKKFNDLNSLLNDTKPIIKDMLVTTRKISEQLVELAPELVKKINSMIADILLGQLKNSIGALTFWLVKKEVEKRV